MINLKRTKSSNVDFNTLISLLDKDLYSRYYNAQSKYDSFNKIDLINTVVIAYDNGQPVGCGCFKVVNDFTVEIKRMFVKNEHRGKGISKMILQELENWSKDFGYKRVILETGTRQLEAIGLYTNSGFKRIPNYGQYRDIETSLCFEKI